MTDLTRIQSDYLYDVLESPTDKKRRIVQKLRDIENVYESLRFEAIAFRGMSGALMAPLVAEAMNKKLILVRKDRKIERTHSHAKVEGVKIPIGTRYIILDDFVSSGETVEIIIAALHKEAPSLVPVGVFEYNKMFDYSDTLSEVDFVRVQKGFTDIKVPKIQHLSSTMWAAA